MATSESKRKEVRPSVVSTTFALPKSRSARKRVLKECIYVHIDLFIQSEGRSEWYEIAGIPMMMLGHVVGRG